jgi:predicted polyphosphate/ATP-dependent NAD kinase
MAAALSSYAERQARKFARGGERHLPEALDPEWLRQMADEIWDEIAAKPLSVAVEIFTPQDLEDFVVLGYEFWLKFRKTRYFATVSTEVVDRLFVKYGGESVRSVVSDMGITEEMIAEELRSFVPPLLEHARRTGFLEQRIRARFEPFYRSEAVATLLSR